MCRFVFSLVFAGIFLVTAQGQTAEEDVIRLRQSLDTISPGEGNTGVYSPPATLQKRGNFGLSAGTSFSYMKGFGSGISLYAAPMYSLAVTSRLSAHAGLIASTYTGLTPGTYSTEYGLPPGFRSLAVFGAASYRMTERLTVHGSGVKYLINSDVPPLVALPPDHFTVGATYKLGDNISIGASLRMDRGHGYYPVSPLQNPYYSSPILW